MLQEHAHQSSFVHDEGEQDVQIHHGVQIECAEYGWWDAAEQGQEEHVEAVLIQVHQGEWSSVIHSNRCEDEQYKGDEDGWTWMYQPKMRDRYRTD